MNRHIEALIKNDYIYFLEEMEKNSPEEFKSAVLDLNNEDSLFMSLFKKDSSPTFISKLLPLCAKYGYSLMSENKTAEKRYNAGHMVINPKKEKLPEILYAITKTHHDKSIEIMLKHLGEENILKLESDGWPLFKILARNNFVESARYLATTKSDFNLTENENDTALNAAERSKEMLAVYWSKMNQQMPSLHMPDNEFFHFNTLIEKKSSSVYRKNESEVSVILGLLETNKNRLTKEQKLKLLKSTLQCVDKSLFKGGLKMFGFKVKDEEVMDVLLKNLRAAGQMEYGYLFLNENYLLKKTERLLNKDENDETIFKVTYKHAIHNIDELLKDLNVILDTRTRYRSKEDKFVSAVMKRLRDSVGKIGYDFLFEKLEEENKTLFEGLTEKKGATFKIVSLIELANISTHNESIFKFKTITTDTLTKLKLGTTTLSQNQEDEIKNLLEKTWFKKEENGQFYIEKYDRWQMARKKIELLNPLLVLPVLNEEQKIGYLRWGFANISHLTLNPKGGDDYMSITFDKVYQEFKDKNGFDWRTINVDLEKLEKSKDTEIYFEIKALLMKSELENNLDKTIVKQKKNKI